MAKRDADGNSAVAFTDDAPRLDDPPAGLEGSGWREAAGHAFGYDRHGRLLWSAPLSGPELSPRLDRPVAMPGLRPSQWEAHALAVIRQCGFRAGRGWRAVALRHGWWVTGDRFLYRSAAGPLGSVRAGAARADLVPSEPGVLRWRVVAPVFRLDGEVEIEIRTDKFGEETVEIGEAPVGDEREDVVGHLDIPADDLARFALQQPRLRAAWTAGSAAELSGAGRDHLRPDAAADVRRIAGALLSAVGGRANPRDLGWLGLRCALGKLAADDCARPGPCCTDNLVYL